MTVTPDYMPTDPTAEELALAEKICNDDKIFSELSYLCNKEKWEYVKAAFSITTLYEKVDYYNFSKREAIAMLADLRAQLLSVLRESCHDYNARRAFYAVLQIRQRRISTTLRENANEEVAGVKRGDIWIQ